MSGRPTVAVRRQVARALGCRVELHRMVGAIVLIERHLGVDVVNAAGAGYELRGGVPASRQDSDRRVKVTTSLST
jgi:hypothetical protein